MKIEELPTPCLLVDLDVAEKNINKMAEFCRGKHRGLRPHVKGIKNPLLAKKQLKAGAVGLACQTLEEMEAMILNGLGPVLLTQILASDLSVERYLNLSREGELMVTVDSVEAAGLLAKAARHRGLTAQVVVEVNVGQNRTGVEPGDEAAKLSQIIARTDGLTFRGLMGYEGHLQVGIPEFEKRKAEDHAALKKLEASVKATEALGLGVEIVTSGGTGTYNIASDYPGITEIQPGSYVMMDHRYTKIETTGRDFQNSLSILSTVVSTPNRQQAVVDLGWKGCGVEYQIFGWDGFPRALGHDVVYSPGGDEHGVLKCERPSERPNFGEKVRFIPAHCDTALNLYGRFYGVRGDEVEFAGPIARR